MSTIHRDETNSTTGVSFLQRRSGIFRLLDGFPKAVALRKRHPLSAAPDPGYASPLVQTIGEGNRGPAIANCEKVAAGSEG
jgi:hypothetical protein